MVLFENECVRVSTLENGDLKIAVGEDFYNLYDDPSISGGYAYWGLPEKKIYEGQLIRFDHIGDFLADWLSNSEYAMVSSDETGDMIDRYMPIIVSNVVWPESNDFESFIKYDGKFIYLDWSIKNEYLELFEKGFLIFSKVQ
jgi:hypothetical protein